MKLTKGHRKIKKTWGLKRKIAVALGISPAAVGQWRRVPAERVIAVEAITGISRAELRPDLYPPSLGTALQKSDRQSKQA